MTLPTRSTCRFTDCTTSTERTTGSIRTTGAARAVQPSSCTTSHKEN
jgi:hypothetical protein